MANYMSKSYDCNGLKLSLNQTKLMQMVYNSLGLGFRKFSGLSVMKQKEQDTLPLG